MDNTDVPLHHWKTTFQPQLFLRALQSQPCASAQYKPDRGADKRLLFLILNCHRCFFSSSQDMECPRLSGATVSNCPYLRFHWAMHMDNAKVPPVFQKHSVISYRVR